MSDVAVQDELEQQVDTCRHHWVIAAPQGATSMGRCKACGETREFSNSAGDALWERDGGAGSASWNSSVRPSPLGLPSDDGF